MKRIFVVLLFCVMLIATHIFAGGSFVGYNKNEIAIKFNDASLTKINMDLIASGLTGIAEIDALSSSYNVVKLVKHFPNFESAKHNGKTVTLDAWFKVRFGAKVDVEAAASKYESLAGIIQADPIPIHKAYIIPNDPDFSSQWHLNQTNDADIDAPEAWDIGMGGANIILSILDTGVRWWHKDLAGSNADNADRNTILGNMWINTDELGNANPDVDEDGNGYNDDWIGWDFVTGSPQSYTWEDEDYDVEDNDPRDYNGHGTHCAGNSAINNNNRGLCSAAGGWGESGGLGNGIKIMPLRMGWSDKWLGMFECGYVSMDFAANAFLYAENNGANIASCSWGCSYYGPLEDGINMFLYGTTSPGGSDPKLRLIFKSAGNDENEETDYMTARSDIIAVSATNESDNAADFTSYGTWVDICAPGNNINSTHHDHYNPDVDDYEVYSGTSMSSPMAASVAGLVWSHNASLTAAEVEDILYQSADDIEDKLDAKYQTKMGAGRLNAYEAVKMVAEENNRPIAVDDNAETPEDNPVTIYVLANDSDPDGDDLTVESIINGPDHGTTEIIATTSVTYTPEANYYGSDSFDYVVSDGKGGLDTAAVNLTIKSRNDPPKIVGLPDLIILEVNQSKKLDMSEYESDIDTPESLLTWSFEKSDPAISYDYNETTDTLTIYASETTGTFYLFTTLTDDSGAFDQDTIDIQVNNTSGIAGFKNEIPKAFSLLQNFPNPFNPVTNIRYGLPKASNVLVEIYSVTGQKVMTFNEMNKSAGYHVINFNASHLSSGIYFYTIHAGDFHSVKKMILMK